MARDRTAEHVRGALKGVAYAGNARAVDAYAAELDQMPDALVDDIRHAAAEVAKVSREHSPGLARKVVDALVGQLDAKHRITTPAATLDERRATAAVADTIQATGSRGRNSASDEHTAARLRAARASLGDERPDWAQ